METFLFYYALMHAGTPYHTLANLPSAQRYARHSSSGDSRFSNKVSSLRNLSFAPEACLLQLDAFFGDSWLIACIYSIKVLLHVVSLGTDLGDVFVELHKFSILSIEAKNR